MEIEIKEVLPELTADNGIDEVELDIIDTIPESTEQECIDGKGE